LAVLPPEAEHKLLFRLFVRRCQEHALAGHDGTGVTAPWKRRLPQDVIYCCPMRHHTAIPALAVLRRSPPPRPISRRARQGRLFSAFVEAWLSVASYTGGWHGQQDTARRKETAEYTPFHGTVLITSRNRA